MIELANRRVDDHGTVVFQVKDLYELILKGFDVTKFPVEDSPEAQQAIATAKMLDNQDLMLTVYEEPTETLDEMGDRYRRDWVIPERYKHLDLRVVLGKKCTTQAERDRVEYEMKVFEKYELQDMLRSLIYLVDQFLKHKIVWGVGRGSSVSSYVLYLIGIHRVDSLAYELDFDEFLN